MASLLTLPLEIHVRERAPKKVNFLNLLNISFSATQEISHAATRHFIYQEPKAENFKSERGLLKPKWLVALASQLIHSLQHSQNLIKPRRPPPTHPWVAVVVVIFLAFSGRRSPPFFFFFRAEPYQESPWLIFSCHYLDVLSGNRQKALKGRWGRVRYG